MLLQGGFTEDDARRLDKYEENKRLQERVEGKHMVLTANKMIRAAKNVGKDKMKEYFRDFLMRVDVDILEQTSSSYCQ